MRLIFSEIQTGVREETYLALQGMLKPDGELDTVDFSRWKSEFEKLRSFRKKCTLCSVNMIVSELCAHRTPVCDQCALNTDMVYTIEEFRYRWDHLAEFEGGKEECCHLVAQLFLNAVDFPAYRLTDDELLFMCLGVRMLEVERLLVERDGGADDDGLPSLWRPEMLKRFKGQVDNEVVRRGDPKLLNDLRELDKIIEEQTGLKL